jgi:hypothetical protein
MGDVDSGQSLFATAVLMAEIDEAGGARLADMKQFLDKLYAGNPIGASESATAGQC